MFISINKNWILENDEEIDINYKTLVICLAIIFLYFYALVL